MSNSEKVSLRQSIPSSCGVGDSFGFSLGLGAFANSFEISFRCLRLDFESVFFTVPLLELGRGVERPDLLSSDKLPLLDVVVAASISSAAPPMLGFTAAFGTGLDAGGGTNLVRF